MALPKYYEIHKPLLQFLSDGKQHTKKEICSYVQNFFKLSPEEIAEPLPSGRQTIFANRVAWATTYLKKSGLILSPQRAQFIITDVGQVVLKENPAVIDSTYLLRFSSFQEFVHVGTATKEEGTPNQQPANIITVMESADETPDDTLERTFGEINSALADDLMAEIMKISPIAFERMVLDLMRKMGYGTFANAAKTTAISGDEGIDGIIMQDKLGFDLIYVQAKQWDLDHTVGRPAIQEFVGAISGRGGKGLFVTTSRFSKQAKEYAARQHIILIDGQRLAELMIEYNFGVTVQKVFEIKCLDTDVFNEYQDI